MFVKISKEVNINLLQVDAIVKKDENVTLVYSGDTCWPVETQYVSDLKYRMSIYNQAIKRLASGSFNS